MEIRMVNHLHCIRHHKSFNGSNSKPNHIIMLYGIIISIWLFHINVLSIIIPNNFILVTVDFILLSQPTQMGICELFLVKNCMRQFSQNLVTSFL